MTSAPDYFTFLPFYLSEAVSLTTFAGSAYLAWRAVRAYERRTLEPDYLRALANRLQSLEAAVETVEGQTRQTSEAQRFTTALLMGSSVAADGQPASSIRDGNAVQVT